MTELTRQIHRAEMSHSLMNGFSALLPTLADENDVELERLMTENAKLRELLKDALPFIAEETGFCTADCFMYPACCDYYDDKCPAVTRIHERARELGVEVSEGGGDALCHRRGAESAAVIHRVE